METFDITLSSDANYLRLQSKLLNYFLKDLSSDEFLGLELEHFVVRKGDQTFVSFYEEFGVEYILKQLKPHYLDSTFQDEYLLGLKRDNIEISLEPGAQLEVSIGKLATIEQIAQEYDKFRSEIDPILNRLQYELVTLGYHPTAMAGDIPLLPKPRYSLMDARFRALGGKGVQMMRGTCATHVTIDYVDNQDFSDKYRVANFLVPVLAFMTDNCTVFEGVLAKPLTRVQIWKDTEIERSGFVPDCLQPDFDLNKYSQYLLNINPMFVLQDDKLIPTGLVAYEAYAASPMDDKDVEHLLSVVFNHVRLKYYIEIRIADSMPIEQTLKYMALVKGVFYNKDNIAILLKKMEGYTNQNAEDALVQLQQKGKDATVYSKPIDYWVDLLYTLARKGLQNDGDLKFLI